MKLTLPDRKLLILLALIALIAIIYVTNSTPPSQTQSVATLTPAKLSPEEFPLQAERLNISGTETANFYSKAQKATRQGDVLIHQSDFYQISYIAQFSQFIISIDRLPFETTRSLAEAEFLKRLEITPEEACRLNTIVVVPASIDPDLAGIQFPLSFCPQQLSP